MTNADEFYFDPSAPLDDSLIPDGWYKTVIINAERKNTKIGIMLKLIHRIADGDRRGETVEDLFFPQDPNKKNAWASKMRLRNLCIAIGVQSEIGSMELIGKEIKCHIGRAIIKSVEINTIKEYACIALTPSSPSVSLKTKEGPVQNHPARKMYTQEEFIAPPPLTDDDVPF